MIKIEFIRPFKCYEIGDTRNAMPHFAKVLIDLGYAKAVRVPSRNKMVERPPRDKGIIS